MIDNDMHKHTEYRIPYLNKQFEEIVQRVCGYITLNRKGWDSYGAKAIKLKTIKNTIDKLQEIEQWFIRNIGFLNNRTLVLNVTPSNNGGIHFEMVYDNVLDVDFYIEEIDVEGFAMPSYKKILDGKHTISDRESNLYHYKDQLQRKKTDINKFLNEVFYIHTWNNKEK